MLCSTSLSALRSAATSATLTGELNSSAKVWDSSGSWTVAPVRRWVNEVWPQTACGTRLRSVNAPCVCAIAFSVVTTSSKSLESITDGSMYSWPAVLGTTLALKVT